MKTTQWIGLCIVVCALLVSVVPASAQGPNITLKVAPAAIKLALNEEGTLLLSTSPLVVPLQDVILSFVGDPIIQVKPTSTPPDLLAPQVVYVWQIQVKPTAAFADARTITARLDYKFKSDGGALTPGAALATFDVQPRAVETVDKVAQLRLETAFDVVQENRPGIAYLIINNVSDVPIKLKQITYEKSDSVNIEASPNLELGRVIPPQASVTAPFTITAQSRVQPGKSNVLFHAEFEWQRANQVSTGTLHAATKFDVVVFGESALTTVFGVPSFLLLPGLLIVAMIRVARSLSKKPLPLDVKSPEFWVLAVMFSLGVAFLYPSIMAGIFHTPRNYLTSYGLFDVLAVWFGSIGLGLLIGLFWNLGELAIGVVQRLFFIPKPDDKPIDVLSKLQRRHSGFALPFATVRQGTRTQRCIVISQDPLTKTFWVAPIARYSWRTNPGSDFLNEFDRELERAQNSGKMLDLVKRTGNNLEIHWEQTNRPIKQPTQVPETGVAIEEGSKCRLLAENKKGSPPARLPQEDDSAP